mmetsp:Transcript_14741/g.55582  ORF Transcript_14741/g.55582 Transcript_14741/m.55582 type:complete len:230 (-) Transcript_14741:528-1217(-)
MGLPSKRAAATMTLSCFRAVTTACVAGSSVPRATNEQRVYPAWHAAEYTRLTSAGLPAARRPGSAARWLWDRPEGSASTSSRARTDPHRDTAPNTATGLSGASGGEASRDAGAGDAPLAAGAPPDSAESSQWRAEAAGRWPGFVCALGLGSGGAAAPSVSTSLPDADFERPAAVSLPPDSRRTWRSFVVTLRTDIPMLAARASSAPASCCVDRPPPASGADSAVAGAGE